jgi:hypothetical protein
MKQNKDSLFLTEVVRKNKAINSKKVWQSPTLSDIHIYKTLNGNIPAASESAYDSTNSAS